MIKRNKIGVAALAAALVFAPFTTVPVNVSAVPVWRAGQQDDAPSEAEQKIFNQGRELFTQGRYEQAATVFRDFLKKYPNSFIADLMLLWLGRSYIELGQLREAEDVGQRLRALKDTPFIDIYESELQNARQEAANRPAQPAATPARNTPAAETIARATPTPTPARVAPTPRTTTPADTAQTRNNTANTPRLTVRSEGTEQRGRRVGPRGNNNARVRPTPPPTTPRDETPVQIAGNTTGSANGTTANTNRTPAPTPTPIRATPTPARTPDAGNGTVASLNNSGGDPTPAPQGGGLSFTVKQVPNLALALRRSALAASPGQAVQLPLVITNTGNKEDQFRLETDLPAEYQPAFVQGGTDTGMPILVTPQLSRGGSLEVTLNIRIPDNAPDNQQQRFLVRAASQADSTITKLADASLTVVAAALNATSNVTQEAVLPGETFTQRIYVRNQGSASARNARADFVFSPDFELVSANPAPINYDRPSRTAIWSLGDLESRDGREISVTLRAVPDALATANRSIGRGTMRTASLFIPSNFDGPAITVGRVPRAQIDAVSTGLTATPGDTVFIPFVVVNPSNYSESFDLRITAPGAPAATIFADSNGDGQHQEGEPTVTQTAAIDPRGGRFPVLLRVDVPRTTPDGQQFAYNIVTRALNAANRVAGEASTVLKVAAPRVRVRTEAPAVEIVPGESIFYRLVLVNDGAGLAKNLVLTGSLPDALQFVSSDPALNPQDVGSTQRFTWRVPELAPGDTVVLRIAVRVTPNVTAESVLTPRHALVYQDTNGNSYQGQ